MEAAGPSMEAMQSTSQSTQLKNTTKKFPSRYQPPSSRTKFRQNNIPSPKVSPPNAPVYTNRYARNDTVSTMRSHQDPIPYPRSFPLSYQIPSSKRSQESAAASPSITSSVDSLKITVNNSADPPQRTVQNDVIPQITEQIDLRPQRPFQFNFPLSRPFQYDQPPERRSKTKPQSFKPHMLGKNQDSMEHVNGEPYRSFQYDYRSPKQSSRENAQQLNPLMQVKKQESMEQGNGEASYQQRPNWRQRKLYNHEEQDIHKKVIVTGFQPYTQPEELIRHLSILGRPQIEIYKNRVAVVVFKTEQEAIAAIRANDTIPVYGNILTILKYTNQRHVSNLMRSNRYTVRHEHKGPPVAAPTEIDISGAFHQQMQNIEDTIRLTHEEVDRINPLFYDIEKFMKMIYPTCEAIPFGSITTGQGIKSSDADCFLALQPGAAGRPGFGAAEYSSSFVNKAARLMRGYPEVFSQIVAIPKANTPIIKFLHVPTNMNCDLNSKVPLGVQNSRLVGHLLNADGAGRFGSVALLLKYWARVHELSGTGRLTNYALLLLLLGYLQRSLLPPVHRLQGRAHSFIVENWEAGFDRTPLPPVDVPPTREILGGFFQYYAEFNFEELVVCPLVGKPLRKADFESDALPPELELYRYNVKEGLALPLRTNRSICIQDPFKLSHNVASSVSAQLATDIKAYMELGAVAYTQSVESGDFIRTILLTRPPKPAPREEAEARVALPGKLLARLEGPWRDVARAALLGVFSEVMCVDLTRTDGVSREAEVDAEVYAGAVTRPVWRRGKQRPPASGDSLQRQRELSERLALHRADIPDVHVPLEVEIGFREEPRGLSVTTSAMEGADLEAFRAFRNYAHSFIHRWCRELLKPHFKKDPVRVEQVKGDTPGPKRTMPKRHQNNDKAGRSIARNEKTTFDPDKRTRSDLDPPIETVAFVNSKHKDLGESLAAISINDSSKKDSNRNNNEAS